MFKKSPVVLVALVVLPACSHRGAPAAPERHDAGPRDAEPASALDAAVSFDARADLTVAPDAPADVVDLRSAAERAYLAFLAAYNARYAERLVGCFNFSAAFIAGTAYREATDSVLTSLRLGLSSWDAALAARCLEALAGAPCLEIANEEALGACRKVIAGRIADDDFCVDDLDCREPGRVCGAGGTGQCGGICQRNLGAPVPAGEGAACVLDQDCQGGLYCRTPAGAGEGVCRPIAPGAACEHPADCPWPYTCVAATCQVGLAAGQPCHPTSDVESDCVYTASCKPSGGQRVCVTEERSPPPPGPRHLPPGATCTDGDTCVLGTFCAFDPAMLMQVPAPPRLVGFCLPWHNPGEPCPGEQGCRPGSECLRGTCASCASNAPADAGAADLRPASADASCAANLKSDPASCGACGRSCQGGSCREGYCSPRAIGTGINDEVQGLAVDETGVYLTESSMLGRVLRVTSDGSAPLKVLAAGELRPGALAIDATHVYWLNGVGAVSRVSKAGGAVEVLASGEAQPTQLALDETHVYWTNQGNPGLAGVRRMAKQGGAPELFAPGESPMGVAVDATHVYWCDWGAGKVQRRSKTGGVVQVLAPSEPDANRIALDAQRVYWSSADHIASVAKTGGPVTIVSPTFNAQDVATDGEGVYWTTNFEVERWKQGPLRLVGGGNVHELEVRGPWVYYVNGSSLLRVAK